MRRMHASLTAVLAALVSPRSFVLAHPCIDLYLSAVASSGGNYTVWNPATKLQGAGDFVRQYDHLEGFTAPSDAGLACSTQGSQDAEPAGGYLAVKPNDTIHLSWAVQSTGLLGPFSVFVAPCNGDCNTLQSTDAKWTKIAEDAYSDGHWGSQRLPDDGFDLAIPANLKADKYIVRAEVIDFGHNLSCPACFQVGLTGSGTCAVPSNGSTFPGAYGNDAFEKPGNASSYIPPGPPVWPGCAAAVTQPKGASGVAASPPANGVGAPPPAKGNTQLAAIIAGSVAGGLILFLLLCCCCYRRSRASATQQREMDEKQAGAAAYDEAPLSSARSKASADGHFFQNAYQPSFTSRDGASFTASPSAWGPPPYGTSLASAAGRYNMHESDRSLYSGSFARHPNGPHPGGRSLISREASSFAGSRLGGGWSMPNTTSSRADASRFVMTAGHQRSSSMDSAVGTSSFSPSLHDRQQVSHHQAEQSLRPSAASRFASSFGSQSVGMAPTWLSQSRMGRQGTQQYAASSRFGGSQASYATRTF